MLTWSRPLVIPFLLFMVACGPTRPQTPLETFKNYTRAIQKKDAATMKVLLSEGTIKMHEKEAAAQGVSVDDIVKRETLFAEEQRSVEFKDEKIDGDKASIKVKNATGTWETIMFVRENGDWKIDKLSSVEKLFQESEDSNMELDKIINGNSEPSL